MAYTHEIQRTADDTGTGFVTGFNLAVAAIALALVIGGIVLFVVQS